jgi:hypothetical protein
MPEFHYGCFREPDQGAYHDNQQYESSIGDVAQHQTHGFMRVEAEVKQKPR